MPASASAEESNRRYRYLLSQGITGLSVAFDLPTQMGMDPDHPLAAGEVGKRGRLHRLAGRHGAALPRHSAGPGHHVDDHQLHRRHSAVALCAGRAKARVPICKKLSGTIQNDILKEYIARGTYIYPPRPAMRIITDLFAWAGRELPEWNTISISGYHIREAGSTAIQEVAFTLANAIAYVEAALEAGLEVDAFAPRLSFFFNAHNDFLEEIAKFRAARRLWAHMMKERFGAKNPKSMMLRFHAQTAGSTLTAQQPDVNVVRVALQAMAAVLGGTQSLHTNSRDEALSLPTEESARSRSPHPAGDRVRNRRDQRAGPSGRQLLHRRADEQNRTGRPRIHRANRRHGRHAGRDRAGLHPERNPKRCLRLLSRKWNAESGS